MVGAGDVRTTSRIPRSGVCVVWNVILALRVVETSMRRFGTVEHRVTRVSPKQAADATSGPMRLLGSRVLTLLTVVVLFGAPVAHVAAHAASGSDHGPAADATECLVCRVASSSPAMDIDTAAGIVDIAPPMLIMSFDLPRSPLVQVDSDRSEFARGPPLAFVTLAGRHTSA